MRMYVSGKTPDLKYSVIIVNFRSLQPLGRMFRSLPHSFVDQAEIIVVNNARDEKRMLTRMLGDETRVQLIEMNENVGFAKACNRGALKASGDILIFLNPDITFQDGSIEAWLDLLSQDSVHIIAPTLLQNGKNEPWSSGMIIHPIRIILQNLFPFSEFWQRGISRRFGFVSGAALAIRKYDFLALGGFDEQFFLYYEDADLCLRARSRGMNIQKDATAVFVHRGGLSHSDKKSQKKHFIASQEYYLMKHYGLAWSRLFHVLRRVYSCLR